MTLRSLDYVSGALHLLARDLLERDRASEAAASPALATPFTNISQADWVEAVRLWNTHGRGSIGSVPPRDCPACGSRLHRFLFDSYDGYRYVECEACGCWFVPLRVEADLFDTFFDRCPQARTVAQRSFASRATPEYAAAAHERIGGYLDALGPLLQGTGTGSNLDVGCGLGHSLQAAAARGMKAIGVESSSDCLRIARDLGLDVRSAGQPLPSGPFRLVSFWESLEHMSDPAEALAACRGLIEPGGLVAFTIPNLLSPLLRLQRGDCSVVHGGYDTPGHINLFGPTQLRKLFERSGFALLDLDGQYGLNPIELVSYAAGLNRGAGDLLTGRGGSGLEEPVEAVLHSIGPAVTLLERIGHLSPILFGLACPKEEAHRHKAAVSLIQGTRRAALVAQIEANAGPVAELDALRHERVALVAQIAATVGPLAELDAIRHERVALVAHIEATQGALAELHSRHLELAERLVEIERQTERYRGVVRVLKDPAGMLKRIWERNRP